MSRPLELVHMIGLRPFADLTPTESERVRAIRNELGVRKNMYTDHEITSPEHQAWMARTALRDDVQMFAVTLQNEIVGAVGLTSITPAHQRAEWAFYLSEVTRGKGLGAALEFKFLNWAFSEARLHKLNCEVLSFNQPVIALHKKFGFREEGVRRSHIYRDGAWIDSILLGMISEEWTEQEAALRERLFK